MECVTEQCCRSVNYKKKAALEREKNCEMLHNVVYNTSDDLLEKSASYDYVYLIDPIEVRVSFTAYKKFGELIRRITQVRFVLIKKN